jgi:hypothetical protein
MWAGVFENVRAEFVSQSASGGKSSIPGTVQDFVGHCIWTKCGARIFSHLATISSRKNRLGREAKHLSPSYDKLNESSFTSTPSHAFMA